MPITESRLKSGTLTLDALSFAAQATNVRITSSTDEVGESLEVLSGDTISPDEDYTFDLVIEAVQDFDDAAGFVNFTITNRGELVPFSWKPNATSPTYTGTVKVRPVDDIGGDVNSRLSTGVTFAIQGVPTITYPV